MTADKRWNVVPIVFRDTPRREVPLTDPSEFCYAVFGAKAKVDIDLADIDDEDDE